MVAHSKVIIAIVNGLVICAAVAVGTAVYLRWRQLPVTQLTAVRIPLVVLGCVLGIAVLSALFGLTSICYSSLGMRVCYLVFVVIVFIAEVGCIAGAFLLQNQIIKLVEAPWNRADDVGLQGRQKVEKEFNCCGWAEYNGSGSNCGSVKPFNGTVCKTVVTQWVKSYAGLVVIVIGVLAIVELIVVISAICGLDGPDPAVAGLTKF
jgi:hypothetical protein